MWPIQRGMRVKNVFQPRRRFRQGANCHPSATAGEVRRDKAICPELACSSRKEESPKVSQGGAGPGIWLLLLADSAAASSFRWGAKRCTHRGHLPCASSRCGNRVSNLFQRPQIVGTEAVNERFLGRWAPWEFSRWACTNQRCDAH